MPEWVSLIDIVFLIVVLLFSWVGARRGIAEPVARVLSCLLLGGAIYWLYPHLYSYLNKLFERIQEGYLVWLTMLGILLLLITFFVLISKIFAGMLKAGLSERANSSGGFFLGFACSCLIGLFILTFVVMLEPSDQLHYKLSEKSKVGQLVCGEIVPRVRENVSRADIDNGFSKLRDNLKEKKDTMKSFE